ncbi:hypothetical protein IFO70_38090 [Phormidium tenue FACHB-886]|nr:hypothetical protein [Phormidium tenue FACHB-886]
MSKWTAIVSGIFSRFNCHSFRNPHTQIGQLHFQRGITLDIATALKPAVERFECPQNSLYTRIGEHALTGSRQDTDTVGESMREESVIAELQPQQGL